MTSFGLFSGCLLLVAACVGHDDAEEPEPRGDPDTPRRVRLTAETVAAFVDYASESTDRAELFAELEAARGDEAVSAALVRELDRAWSVAEDVHAFEPVGGVGRTSILLSILRHLPSALFLEPLLARVDLSGAGRPEAAHIEALQSEAAAAAVCIGTSEASSALRARAASHPSRVVREAIAEQLRAPVCDFWW